MNEQAATASPPRSATPQASRVDLANEAIRAIVRAGQPYVGPEEISYLAPHIKLVFTTVPIDLATQDAYQDKRTRLWVTTNRVHLRLLRAAGVDILPSSGPIETGDPERIEYRMCARALGFDGRHQEWTACYELNLKAWRQDLEASKEKDPAAALNEIRKHGLSRAESGARGRLVQLVGLDRRGFTMDAVKRGFKVASAVIDVGDDPTGRDMLLAASLGLAGLMYGPPAAPVASRPRPASAAHQAELPPPATEMRIDRTPRPAAPAPTAVPAPAAAPMPPTAPSAPAAPASTAAPFETLSAEKQIAELKALAERKRYALDTLKTGRGAGVTLADFSAAQRLKFYEHLNRLPDVRH